MIDKKRLKKVWDYSLAIVGIIVAIYFIFYVVIYSRIQIFTNSHYTIAEVVDFGVGKSGRVIKYVYVVEGQEYRDSRVYRSFKLLDIGKGDKLYVKFAKDDYNVSVLLNCCKIEDESLTPPPSGWTLEELQKIDLDFVDNYQFFWFTSTDDPDLYPLPKKDTKK